MISHKHVGSILLSPRITEKGAYLSSQNVYVFNVARSANKREIAEAIRQVYKVTPKRIAVITTPPKRVKTRGTNRPGYTAQGKKAYVYLKQGDVIEFN